MSVRKKIDQSDGIFFITITCARWLQLYKITNGYHAVYKWFDYLKENGHHIVCYVIMPSHVHVLIAFTSTNTSINTIVSNGKRFMAYELVKLLQCQNQNDILIQLSDWVNATQKLQHKKHEVFEPSFDCKECYTRKFVEQKINYIHLNPCKEKLAKIPEDYTHSSAQYYYTGMQGVYPVITYMELQDIDLTSSLKTQD